MGIVPTNGGGGILLSLEPKYNIKDNMNVGLRIGVAAIVRDVNDSGGTTSAKASASNSYVATYDYYFNASGKSFVPYIGAGAGYYSIANVQFDDTNNSTDVNVDAAYHIYENLKKGELLITEGLGHRKILGNEVVIKNIIKFIHS